MLCLSRLWITNYIQNVSMYSNSSIFKTSQNNFFFSIHIFPRLICCIRENELASILIGGIELMGLFIHSLCFRSSPIHFPWKFFARMFPIIFWFCYLFRMIKRIARGRRGNEWIPLRDALSPTQRKIFRNVSFIPFITL